MGTPDYCVFRCMNGHGKDDALPFKRKILEFAAAFQDILDGLGKDNRREDRSYHREKITLFLFASVFEHEDSVETLGSKLIHLRNCYGLVFSHLTWDDFFEVISFLGLGPEFAAIVVDLDTEIQELVGSYLYSWVKSKTNYCDGTDNEDIAIVCIYLSSVAFTLTLKSTCSNFSHHLQDCYSIICEILGMEQRKPALAQCTINYIHMECVKGLVTQMKSNHTSELIARSSVPTPEVFFLRRLTEAIKDDKENLQRVLMTVTDSTQKNDMQSTTAESKLLLTSALNSMDYLSCIDSESIGEMRLLLSNLLGCVPKDTTVWKNDLNHADDVYVVSNFLEGYEDSAVRLLKKMVCEPLENASWNKHLAAFYSSPECLAVGSNLLMLLQGVSRCLMATSYYGTVPTDVLALEFQQLFWKGFSSLSSNRKYDVAQEIIYIRKESSLLSEYPSNSISENKSRYNEFEQSKQKRIRLFFEALSDQDDLSDGVRAKFSEICLQSPSLCLKILIENAFYRRIQSLPSLLFEWDYLLQFPYGEDHRSMFWTAYFAALSHRSHDDDEKSLDNGLAFLVSLLEKFAHSGSEHFNSLKTRSFDWLSHSVSDNAKFDSTERILHLRILKIYCESSSLIHIVPVQKLLALCVTLSKRIDALTSLWQSAPKFSEKEEELLDDVFDALYEKILKKLSETRLENPDYGVMIAKWLSHISRDFLWTTKLRLLSILRKKDDFKLSVPACLAEVCEIPPVFDPSPDLCYGTGTGLLAWLQCFLVDSSLCPLHSLAVKFLEVDDVKLLTAGWTVAMSQILPFCKTKDWLKLTETTKVLIHQAKLYCPYQFSHDAALPSIDVSDAISVLSVVQMLKNVSSIICNSNCVDWTSRVNYRLLTKQFSEAFNWLVSDSPEFAKAKLSSQLFILSQMFCSACSIARQAQSAGRGQAHSEALFVLCLDLLGSFERVFESIPDRSPIDDAESGDVNSFVTPGQHISDDGKDIANRNFILETTTTIQDMMYSASLMGKEQWATYDQKLAKLLQRVKESWL